MPTYEGDHLREIAFPLGGIGTGTVSLGGRGNLRDWEIFNRPGKGRNLPYTFFALHVEREDGPPVTRALERRLFPPFTGVGHGPPTAGVPGLPRFRDVRFQGEYPFAWIDFVDDLVPVQVQLEAFNPFIPLNAEDSGLPVALFRWRVTNSTSANVKATVVFSLLNAVGYNGKDTLGNRFHKDFGVNLNAWRSDGNVNGVLMTGSKPASNDPSAGSMAIATDWPDVSYRLRWERAGWWDDAQDFWDRLRDAHGRLPSDPEANASPDGQTDVASLALHVDLAPGESATLPFTLAWHFPNLTNDWNGEPAVQGKRLGNWYTTRRQNAWESARYAIAENQRMEADTRAFHAALFSSTLPAPVLDAISANMSIVRTPTVLRTEDGRMNAFEGCNDNIGSCPMNCTHVWNYVQTVAFLFPELERSVRETDFLHNTRPNGDMAFRTLLPLIGELWDYRPAADGQMGTIIKAYREWMQCGDIEFLSSLWPGIERALEFAWEYWDPDRDGVMEGEQHNTYDIEFFGPNTMMGTLYLGALRAAERMANALGHTDKAEQYRTVFESGSKGYSEMLFNGEFFRQIVLAPGEDLSGPLSAQTHLDSMRFGVYPRYQYGDGCLSDQLLGQWFARVVGLGELLPADQVRSALKAIIDHNWKPDLSGHDSVQRVYAVNDEGGLLLCTWPRGGRPQYPFPYADEVWTGIEYQVAAHCVYEGLINEGFAIVEAARARHDGEKRNPWDEFECGHHYARAMSSWSLLLALSGAQYNASSKSLRFSPAVNVDNFRCFFSTAAGWGIYSRTGSGAGQVHRLELKYGKLDLNRLDIGIEGMYGSAELNGRPLRVATVSNGAVCIAVSTTVARRNEGETDPTQVTMSAGDLLEIRVGPTPTTPG